MSEEFTLDERFDIEGLTIAPGVVETLVSLAVSQVEGVACVGSNKVTGGVVMQVFSKKHTVPGVLIYEEDGDFVVDVNVQVLYGYRLPQIAENIRAAVVDALDSQVGIEVSTVNISIDSIQFVE